MLNNQAPVPIIHDTFTLERSYPAGLQKVFAAFADPAQKRRWFIESGHHHVEHYEMDFREGGKESARFRFKEGTPVAGLTCTNDGVYLYIVPNARIVIAHTMAIAGKAISASLVTCEFLGSENGTDLVLTHQGAFFEGSDGPEMRQDGWRKLLDQLSRELA